MFICVAYINTQSLDIRSKINKINRKTKHYELSTCIGSLRSLLIKAPFCPQRFLKPLWLGELERTGLLRHGGALLLRLEAGDQFGDQSAGLLWVEVTSLLRNIDQSVQLG